MAKRKTSKKQKLSLQKGFTAYEPDFRLLLDKKLVVETLSAAILDNDFSSFRDVLIAHLRTKSMTALSKETGLGRRTLYDLMEEKNFDPRLSTLGALLSKIVA